VGDRSARITDRDIDVLAFIAEHRIVRADHVRAMLGVSATVAYRRLRALTGLGMLSRHPLFAGEPSCYRITGQGLAVIDSSLQPPGTDVRNHAHDLGLAWVWLAAHRGAFGAMREVVSERRMRSQDATEPAREDLFAVRLGGVGAGGKPRLHYPDLLLIDNEGRRVAVELELTSKGRRRVERILAAYGADPRIEAVLYLVDRRSVGNLIRSCAARADLSDRVHVQEVRWADGRRPGAAAQVRERVRPGTRSRGQRASGPRASGQRASGQQASGQRASGPRPSSSGRAEAEL
jgi:hypothetical protein